MSIKLFKTTSELQYYSKKLINNVAIAEEN